jgi:hypothetical protein
VAPRAEQHAAAGVRRSKLFFSFNRVLPPILEPAVMTSSITAGSNTVELNPSPFKTGGDGEL